MQINKYKQQVGFVRFYGTVLFVIALSFWAGYEIATTNHTNALEEVAMINQSMDNLMEDNQRLNSALNKRKIELDVQRLTNEKTQLEIRELLKNETALKQQISFYQRVMAPETTQDGFVVERVEINATQSTNNFEMKLMLLQHENIKAVIKGTLNIQLVGSLNDEPKSYAIDDLQNVPKNSLDFGFKYFQVLVLNVTLPEGFEPARLEISTDVYKYKRKRGSYSSTVDWSDAYASEERILD
ncbi:DUF6776 family protein [Agaribacter marinus]|uniref:Uncharacterized protein n=1 Tax=Agaribacter marinus TaxID=1431249 RepID=A0AA37SZ39_9ALTE|nr:DUF6776 family protein [Agaribacter marinus]GLR72343.1 hypothetical protein GCM10007852_32510 [Agaribacter marinus]